MMIDYIQDLKDTAVAWEKIGVDQYAVEELRHLIDKLEQAEKS